MNILGLSCYYHDAAVALLQNGQLVAAAEEERLSRVKHDSRFPRLALDLCLSQAKLRRQDLDYVAFYEKPLIKLERILTTSFASYPHSWKIFREASISWLKERLWIKDKIASTLDLPADRVLFVDHHTSHAASAFFCSPFTASAILTIDGVGEWSTATFGTARGDWHNDNQNRLQLTHELRFPHSLGLLYSVFTSFLGFEVNDGEYKVMGMAPYGEPRYLTQIERIAQVSADGSLALDLDYFEFHRSLDCAYSRKFMNLFGAPRSASSDFVAGGRDSQRHADIAASIQCFTEEVILKMATHLSAITKLDQLCMAGGVALNSMANGRLLRESPFKQIFIQPAAGDSGAALGAALYVWHVGFGRRRTYVMENAFLGTSYADDDIAAQLRSASVAFEPFATDDDLIEVVSRAIQDGQVVGWFQGRFEWGPRALGNRSILADPRNPNMKDLVNGKIKFREAFRPFAPAILEDRVSELFDGMPSPENCYPARFMQLVWPWKKDFAERVPAVDHFGTGRLQAVCRERNQRFHALLERFAEDTGIPVLLNTSFNLRGEPIVSTPSDALRTFHNSDLDLLVLGNHLVRK